MNKQHLVLLVILIFTAILRFYNLNWGAPFYFHPDERNMAHAVTQLQPRSLNPRFFAYGQFPLYFSYFSGVLGNFLANKPVLVLTFPQAIFWLRFWSALSSTLTVLLVFLISCKLFTRNPALLTTGIAAFTPGLIQSAHFGTTESLLTFFFMLIVYLTILLINGSIRNLKFVILNSIVLGLAVSTKVSAILFFAAPVLALLLRLKRKNLIKTCLSLFLIFNFSFLIFFLTSPFNFLDFRGFMGSMNYEIAVATGETKVFYTRQFENTTPILFQLTKIFPHTLGVPIFIFGLFGFGLCLVQLVIRHSFGLQEKKLFLILWAFLIYFLPNAFLFAKWTRFMTPVFPLFAIFVVYLILLVYNFFNKFYKKYKISKTRLAAKRVKYQKYLFFIFNFSFLILLFLPGLAFFSIYARPDVRVTASQWIYANIPSGSYILSETANVIDIPLFPSSLDANHYSLSPVSFNFYELDENPTRLEELLIHLELADYIFIPSRRIFTNHMKLSDTYPLTSRYYELLFSGKLGFEKIAEFSSYPSLSLDAKRYPLAPNSPDERSEESFTVFDHPVIRIYQKTKNLSSGEYQQLLTGY